jgi:hypothetical protein
VITCGRDRLLRPVILSPSRTAPHRPKPAAHTKRRLRRRRAAGSGVLTYVHEGCSFPPAWKAAGLRPGAGRPSARRERPQARAGLRPEPGFRSVCASEAAEQVQAEASAEAVWCLHVGSRGRERARLGVRGARDSTRSQNYRADSSRRSRSTALPSESKARGRVRSRHQNAGQARPRVDGAHRRGWSGSAVGPSTRYAPKPPRIGARSGRATPKSTRVADGDRRLQIASRVSRLA